MFALLSAWYGSAWLKQLVCIAALAAAIAFALASEWRSAAIAVGISIVTAGAWAWQLRHPSRRLRR